MIKLTNSNFSIFDSFIILANNLMIRNSKMNFEKRLLLPSDRIDLLKSGKTVIENPPAIRLKFRQMYINLRLLNCHNWIWISYNDQLLPLFATLTVSLVKRLVRETCNLKVIQTSLESIVNEQPNHPIEESAVLPVFNDRVDAPSLTTKSKIKKKKKKNKRYLSTNITNLLVARVK